MRFCGRRLLHKKGKRSKYGLVASMAYTFHRLHPTIPKYPTVSLICVAAEPFSEACCSACIGLFVPSSSTASSALPAKHHWPTNSGPAFMGSKAHISSVSSAARCALQAWPHILALFAPLLWQHELLLLEGLHNLQLPANTKAISNTRLFLVSMHYNSHPGADATKPNADVHPCRKGEGEAVCTAESPRRFAQPTCQLPHAPARQQSICQAAQPSLRLNVAPFPAAGSLRRLQGETAAASTPDMR